MDITLNKIINGRRSLALLAVVPVALIAATVVIPTSTVSLQVTATPQAVAQGQSTIISWASSGASVCKGRGSGFPVMLKLSGSAIVTPSATTTYDVRCVALDGSAALKSVTVTVSGTTPIPTPTPTPTTTPTPTPTPTSIPSGGGNTAAFSNPDDGNIPDRSMHPLAFPTATGFGKNTSVRASNAVVYKINTLQDVADPNDGKISYRECALALAVNTPYSIPAGRPRYCVFDVSGAIIMQSSAFIQIPKIYIAGQTSPGGIEFRLGANYNPVDSLIDTRRGGDNMILRHVRTRTGPHVGRPSQNGDPIRMSGTNNQILDHVSTMFGTDESLDMACTNCTVQWSIIGPNICRNAGHTSSLHCKTFFLKPSSRVTIAHNLSQHGEQRGINISVGTNPAKTGNTGQADIINNVLYNFIAEAGLVSNQFASVYANYVGNAYLRGPKYNATDGNYLIAIYSPGASLPFGFDIYSSGNVTPRSRIAGLFGQTTTDPTSKVAGFIDHVDPTQVCGLNSLGTRDCAISGLGVVKDSRYALMPGQSAPSFLSREITNAEQAMRDVLTFAGANLCRDGACRDNVDAMYIDDVRTCDTAPYLFDSAWPSTVAEAGGWALLQQGPAKLDSDNDGMPDEWERRFRNTNPNAWDANADADGDGYPNIEEYLNSLAQDDVRYYGQIGFGTGALPKYNCGRPMF